LLVIEYKKHIILFVPLCLSRSYVCCNGRHWTHGWI